MACHAPLPAGTANGTGFTAVRQAQATVQAGLVMGDWDVLLDAVKARLRLSVDELSTATAPALCHDPAAQMCISVLECLAALDQLHGTLRQEPGRRQHLDLEVVDAQTALAHARAELGSMQAGERHARHLAARDALTSLPKRNHLRERLDLALASDAPQRQLPAVFHLDLDGFKPINDQHGHAVGDEVLRIVAMRRTPTVRADGMVSRQGGDEFACLVVGGLDRAQLARLAGTLFDAVAATSTVGELRLTVQPSIGIAISPVHGMTADDLFKHADEAMYRAKRVQSGFAFYGGDAVG